MLATGSPSADLEDPSRRERRGRTWDDQTLAVGDVDSVIDAVKNNEKIPASVVKGSVSVREGAGETMSQAAVATCQCQSKTTIDKLFDLPWGKINGDDGSSFKETCIRHSTSCEGKSEISRWEFSHHWRIQVTQSRSRARQRGDIRHTSQH